MGWGVADQGMSSLTNFAVNIYVAHRLGAASYGAFVLAYVTYHFALNASRGLSSDPLMVRFSATDLASWRGAVASATGTATATGLVAGVVVLGVTPLLGGSTRLAFLALGLTLPGLLLQDCWRFAFFAHGRGVLAFLNDTVWAVALFASFAALRVTGHDTLFWIVFAWGASAACGAAIGPLQARVLPRISATRQWLATHWDLAPRYLAEGTLNSATAQLVTYSIGVLLGLAAVGAVQAASLLMGPYMVMLWGLGLVLMPEAVRISRESLGRLRHLCILVSVSFAAFAAVWGLAILIALPMGLGQALLGNLWHEASPLVVPTTAFVMASVILGGAGLGLHALGAARRSLRATIVTSVTYLAFSVVGAVAFGKLGAVSGGAVAMCLGAVVFWRELGLAIQESAEVATTSAPSPHCPVHGRVRVRPRHSRSSVVHLCGARRCRWFRWEPR
jgi:O-antigen/teichoic acid export membrane protein